MIGADLYSSGGYPALGKTDTSEAGAHKIAPHAAAIREKVLADLAVAGSRGLTVVEFCDGSDAGRFGAQPRFTELRKLGRIVDSGQRRKNPSGVNAIVWTLKEASNG